jgi:ubiquinone/menaquinone biosynthesis C-methylase UbiE
MKTDQTIEYYQKRAPEYDKIYFRDNPDRQAELGAMYAVSRRTLRERHVLDPACGTGYWTKIVSEQAASIVGVDINSGTLSEARRKHFVCPIFLVQGDFYHLPFGERQFSGLLATYVVSHVRREDIGVLRDEMRRLVAAGSPVFMCDNNAVCEPIPDLIWDEEHVNSYRRRKLENGEEFVILKNYFKEAELTDIFESWGTIEKLTYDTYYWSVVLRLGA